VRKYCDSKKVDLEILTDVHVFNPLPRLQKECFNAVYPSVCVYVSMYGWMVGWVRASLAPERLDGFYSYSEFSVAIIGWCPVYMNTPVQNMGGGALQHEPQNVK
jgi:hypothetical protein